MKSSYSIFLALLCATAFLSGCADIGIHSSKISTPGFEETDRGFYIDAFGRRHPDAGPAVVSPYDAAPEAFVGSVSVYSGSYYGRPLYWDNDRMYREGGYRRAPEFGHHPPDHAYRPPRQGYPRPPVRYGPPIRYVPPRRYPVVQPPYILPPSGSVTVVHPIYRRPWPYWPPGHH